MNHTDDRADFASEYYHDATTPTRMREVTLTVTLRIPAYEDRAVIIATGCGPEMEEAVQLVFADNGIDSEIAGLEVKP